jgi:hypothetical protein
VAFLIRRWRWILIGSLLVAFYLPGILTTVRAHG